MWECVSERDLQERRVKVDKFIAVGLKEKPKFIKKNISNNYSYKVIKRR